MKQKILIALLGIALFASCKKTETNQVVSISSLQISTGSTTIASNGIYGTSGGKFTFNYTGIVTGNCGFTMDITVHDGNNTRSPAIGIGDQLATTATFPNGAMVIDFTGVAMNYLTQVNITFTPRLNPGDTYTKGHDQVTFFVRRTN